MSTIDERSHRLATTFETVRIGAIAGAAGGLAEIAWVTLYAAATGTNAAMLARGVTTAAGISTLLPDDAVALGVTTHMGIAVMLGVGLALVWRAIATRSPAIASPFPFTVAALLGIWAMNFFVVLPIVSPAFILLVPYSVSLISKLLFGLAAAGVFRLLAAPSTTMQHARIGRRV